MSRDVDPREVVIRAFPRLHFGLLDLGRATARAYGGSGVMLDGPSLEIAARPSHTFDLSGIDRLDDRGQSDVRDAIGRLELAVGRSLPVRLEFRSKVLQHVGLGSKTALLLGVLKAIAACHAQEVSPTVLQRASGRGGTSGVGIHGFFHGGFLVDSGRPQPEVMEFGPSGAGRPDTLPVLACRLSVPAGWRFWLIQHEGPRIAGQDEMAFFRRSTPVPAHEVLAALALTFHGLVPAIASCDLAALRHSIAALQQVGFKRRELRAQSEQVQLQVEALLAAGLAAGLSSMGPLVFAITAGDDPPPILEALIAATPEAFLGVFGARNDACEEEVVTE